MTMETKKEVFSIELSKYLKANKEEKSKILDSLKRQTGMHRKSIIRALRREQLRKSGDTKKRGRKEYYGADVTAALKEIWSYCGEVCGELLCGAISETVSILQHDRMWIYGDETTGKLLTMSEATVRRRVSVFLKAGRTGKGKSTTNPSDIKERIPVFCGPWNDVSVGHGQIDTVVHCGSTLAGNMIYTVSYTDVASGWWEGRAQWNKGMEATKDSLSIIKDNLIIPWFHVHPDCGTEFLNRFVIEWSIKEDMRFTRSRSYHKNDNAYVEQKNGHVIRKELGYRRIDCREVIDVMNKLYTLISLHRNHFVPQRKLISKERHGAKYKKKYDKAKTPYKRVLADNSVSEAITENLTQIHAKLNPKVLTEEITKLKSKLFKLQKIHGSDVR